MIVCDAKNNNADKKHSTAMMQNLRTIAIIFSQQSTEALEGDILIC